MDVHPLVAVLIYLLGLGLLFLELFIPSGGILGILGSICSIFGIIELFKYNGWVGVAIVLVTIAYAYVILKFWAKRVKMTGTLSGRDSHTPEASPTEIVGAEGETVTVLRPAGFARIAETRYQVVAEGRFLPKGAKVRVVDVTGNRIVVAEVEEPKVTEEENDAL